MQIITGHKTKGSWWFRIFGVGIAWKNTRLHRKLFSERKGGNWKSIEIGNWYFKYLPKQSESATHL
jgi:hypothetical protein